MASQSKIKCTFEGCNEHFANEKDMKKHKKHSDEHEYCHICDIDFDNWEIATAHKSQMGGMDIFKKTQMQYKKEKESGVFWNIRDKISPDYGNLKFHPYACKFCGMSYKTESARQLHTQRVS